MYRFVRRYVTPGAGAPDRLIPVRSRHVLPTFLVFLPFAALAVAGVPLICRWGRPSRRRASGPSCLVRLWRTVRRHV